MINKIKELKQKYLTKTVRTVISLIVIVLGIAFLVNYSFFSPTYINKYIATNIYKAPANNAFDDQNFYNAVVDAYNLKNSKNLPYTTNLTDSQLKTITSVYARKRVITSTKGLEKLTALTVLDAGYNQLTSLDVSNNTALTYLNARYNKLTSLDVSNNTALTDLDVAGNQLTSLDVSNNTALTDLDVGVNQLTSLDVSNNTALETLYAYSDQLTSLDVSKNTALTYLDVSGNQLTSLDVSNNTALTYLDVGWNHQLTSLDVSNNTALTYLEVGVNQLTSLDVSNNTALETLHAYNNQLTSLDVSNNTALTHLDVGNNKLTSLDVSKNTALTQLSAYNSQLTSLDVSNNTALIQLIVVDNKLTSLDVSNNTALTYLSVGNNKLTSLDVSNNTALTCLSVSSNKLTSLDVSKHIALEKLYAYNIQLTSLDVSNNTALTHLYVGSNKLTSLDVSNNTALTHLDVGSNKLTSLDVSNNTKLTELQAHKNQLTSLDVSNNTALETLHAYNNQLTSLDVSNNTALETLNIDDNPFGKNVYLHVGDTNSIVSPVKLPSHFDNSIAWKSYNLNVATVDNNGNVNCLNRGITKIITTNKYYEFTTYVIVDAIASDKYYIDADNSYIYLGLDTDIETIKSNINLIDNSLDISIDLDKNELYLLYSDQVVYTFNIGYYTSSIFDLSGNYIYTSTLSDNEIKGKVLCYNCKTKIEDDYLVITDNTDKEMDRIKLIRLNIDYTINTDGNEKYIYTAYDSDDEILSKVTASNGGLTRINGYRGNLEIGYGLKFKELLDKIKLYRIESEYYTFGSDYVYTGNKDFLLAGVSTTEGLNKKKSNNKLQILYKTNILSEYKILTFKVENFVIDDEQIYVEDSISYNDFMSNITKVGNITCKIYNNEEEITSGNIQTGMILKVYYNDEILDEYEISAFKIENLMVKNDRIYIEDSISYNDFMSNIIKSENITCKIYNNEEEVTSGNVEKGMVLKVYYNGKVIKEYKIIDINDEYLEFDNNLIVDEDNKIINKISSGLKIENVIKKINTSANIDIFDKNNNEITDKSGIIKTGYKFKIGLAEPLEYKISVKGDASGDGLINVTDISYIINTIQNREELEKEYFYASDVNDDNVINVTDISIMINAISGNEEL